MYQVPTLLLGHLPFFLNFFDTFMGYFFFRQSLFPHCAVLSTTGSVMVQRRRASTAAIDNDVVIKSFFVERKTAMNKQTTLSLAPLL